jgi:hypothetical protein
LEDGAGSNKSALRLPGHWEYHVVDHDIEKPKLGDAPFNHGLRVRRVTDVILTWSRP